MCSGVLPARAANAWAIEHPPIPPQDYNVREFVLRRTRESFRLNAALADADAAAALAKVRA